jgi:hypothetical protein
MQFTIISPKNKLVKGVNEKNLKKFNIFAKKRRICLIFSPVYVKITKMSTNVQKTTGVHSMMSLTGNHAMRSGG